MKIKPPYFSMMIKTLFYVLLWCCIPSVYSQTFPSKPIRIVVGFSPGGAADITARIISHPLGEQLGQSIIIDNRTGAGGLIANARVASSPPDGYTLLIVSAAAVITPAMRRDMPYDIEKDLTPIALIVKSSHILLNHPSVPIRNVKDLIALAKARPGQLSFGHSGFGSANHMAGELFNIMTHVKIKHVPYKGGADNVLAAVSGQIELTYGSLVSAVNFIKSGQLIALGLTGSKRSALLPEVPTISEAGIPGYESTAWYALLAPSGVAKPIVNQLNSLIVKAGQSVEIKDAFMKQGLDPQTDSAEQFGEFIHKELTKYKNLAKAGHLKID